MRIAVLIAWLALMAFLLLSLPLLPAQVGEPGKETSRLVYLLSLMGPATLMLLLNRFLLPWLARRAPRLIDMPHRDYWLAEPRREDTILRLQSGLAQLSLLVMTLMAGAHGFILLQSKGMSLPAFFWWGAGALWAVVFLVCVLRIRRAFALPKS